MIPWLSKTPLVHAADGQVCVLTGQSNSLGPSANATDADRIESVAASDAETKFFWSNVSSRHSAYPIDVLYGNSAEVISSFVTQQVDGSASPNFWRPEFGFACAMAVFQRSNIMVVKAGRGGGGNTLRSKAAFSVNPFSGHMYQHVLDTVGNAVSQLTDLELTDEIKGQLNLQGEIDSASEAANADTHFNSLQANLCNDLPNATNLHAVIGGIAACGSI